MDLCGFPTHAGVWSARVTDAAPLGPAEAVDLDDPRWFLDDLELSQTLARFVRTERDILGRQAFLDPRWDRGDQPRAELPGLTLEAPPGPPARLNFIWHTSFCCSTAIAAALDAPSLNLSLKEPQALVTLANLKRGQQGRFRRAGIPRGVFSLLARRFEPDEQVLIKPSNFANNLMAEAAETTDGRMLMLYSSCRAFLASIVKAGEARRGYARDLFLLLAADGHPQARWPMNTLLRLSDLHIGAVAWHMQMAAMHEAMQSLGERAVSLDADRFLQDPRRGLEALDAFFGLGLGPERIEARLKSGFLERDVKTGETGGPAKRSAEFARVDEELGPQLDRLADWAARASPDEASAPLPRALV